MVFNRIILVLLAAGCLSCDGPDDKKGRFLLKGNERLQEKDYKGARQFYTEALQIDNNFPEAYYNLGITYQMTADYEAAIREFTQAIERKNDYADAYYQRSLAYLDFGENYRSLEDARQLIELEGEARGYYLLGLGHEAVKNYPEALDAFSQALTLDPENVPVLVNRATMFFYLDELDKALADLQLAEKHDPQEANIYNLRSMIAFTQGDYAQAKDWVEQAIALNTSQPYYYNNRGLYRLYLGDLEQGLEDINLSLKQNSKNLYALRNKGIYYALNGDEDLARKYLEEVFNSDPELPLTQMYLEKLANR